MDTTEIKKKLYKMNPTAYLIKIHKGIAYYQSSWMEDGGVVRIGFSIPMDDMGEAPFEKEMEGKLLARWISSQNLTI